MSKAPATPPAEGEAPPKKSKKLLIIILVVVLLLVIAGGAAAFLLLNKKKADHGDEAHEPEAPKLTVDTSKPPTFVNLDPFTVNLAPAEGSHYLQVVLVLKVVDQTVADQLKVYMPEIRHEVNLLLSSKLPSEIATVEGREALAEEIMIRTNYVLGFDKPRDNDRRRDKTPWGPVMSVLFNSLIVQ